MQFISDNQNDKLKNYTLPEIEAHFEKVGKETEANLDSAAAACKALEDFARGMSELARKVKAARQPDIIYRRITLTMEEGRLS